MNTQVKGPKTKRWAGVFVTLLSLAVILYPIVTGAEENISGRLVQPTLKAETGETPSFGAEDWVPPQGEAQVVAVETPLLGAEDWVPPQGETRIVKVETPSFGAEDFVVASTPSSEAVDWAGAMEPSDAVGTGAIPAPAPAPKDLSLDDYYPD